MEKDLEKDFAKVGVALPAWPLDRRIIYYYLKFRDCCWNKREFGEMLQRAPDKQFYEMISKHMNAFT